MTEKTKQLNVEQHLLVNAAADEILDSTSIHQQALVRMLAVASEHQLNAANLLEDLEVEMHSSTARDIPEVVDELRRGVSNEAALAQVPGVVPEPVVLAVAAARAQGLQKPLNQALLNGPAIRRSQNDHAQDTSIVSKLTGLFWRFVFTLNILTFVMLFIVPQFKDMYDEFGIELPVSMGFLIFICNVFTYWWFLFVFFAMAIGVTLFFMRPHLFRGYFTRWIPSRWQQPVLTKSARKDRSLAWVVQSSDDSKEAAVRFVSNSGIGVSRSKRRAAAEKIEAGADVMEALTSERVVSNRESKVVAEAASNESAGWILRKRSHAKELSSHYRGLTGIRLFIWLGDFFLMFIGGLLAIAVFQSLITIIRGLT